jgi:hypothetical protein
MFQKSFWLLLVWGLMGAGEVWAACENGSGSLASITTLCSVAQTTGLSFQCKDVVDHCKPESHQVFTGATIELASPTNIKTWNGRGGAGREYALAAVCALRDLRQQSMTAAAEAETMVGPISLTQELAFLGFQPGPSPVVRGYQRARTCMPALGCIDGLTQEFTVSPIQVAAPAGSQAGQYAIQRLHAVNVTSDRLQQSLTFEGPKFDVPTPIGLLNATPRFSFGRQIQHVTRPYSEGNVKSTLTPNAHVVDVLGTEDGLNATKKPAEWMARSGWLSQIGLGGRAAERDGSLWMPGAEEWPARPDGNVDMARSPAERSLNVRAGAEIDILYDLLENWAPAKALKETGLLTDSRLALRIRPSVAYRGSTQWNLWNGETVEWSFLGEFPPPVPKLQDLDQFRLLGVYGGASVAGAFRVDLGVDFHLEIDPPLAPNIVLVNFEKSTRLINEETKPTSKSWPKQVVIGSQAKKILAGQPFTVYQTLTGAPSAKDHLAACLKGAKEEKAVPPVTWEPGDPQDLLVDLRYPCNVCLQWAGGTVKLPNGSTKSYPGFGPGFFAEASQDAKPEKKRWKCNSEQKVGCHDVCSATSDGKLVVLETAIELEDRGVGRKGCGIDPINIH